MQEQLVSVARPLPEAPPRARMAGDLGPAKAESSVLGRACPQSLSPYVERSTEKPHRIKPVLYHVRKEEQCFSSRWGSAVPLCHRGLRIVSRRLSTMLAESHTRAC